MKKISFDKITWRTSLILAFVLTLIAVTCKDSGLSCLLAGCIGLLLFMAAFIVETSVEVEISIDREDRYP